MFIMFNGSIVIIPFIIGCDLKGSFWYPFDKKNAHIFSGRDEVPICSWYFAFWVRTYKRNPSKQSLNQTRCWIFLQFFDNLSAILVVWKANSNCNSVAALCFNIMTSFSYGAKVGMSSIQGNIQISVCASVWNVYQTFINVKLWIWSRTLNLQVRFPYWDEMKCLVKGFAEDFWKIHLFSKVDWFAMLFLLLYSSKGVVITPTGFYTQI